jgi:hypothetical protein
MPSLGQRRWSVGPVAKVVLGTLGEQDQSVELRLQHRPDPGGLAQRLEFVAQLVREGIRLLPHGALMRVAPFRDRSRIGPAGCRVRLLCPWDQVADFLRHIGWRCEAALAHDLGANHLYVGRHAFQDGGDLFPVRGSRLAVDQVLDLGHGVGHAEGNVRGHDCTSL